MPQRASQRKRLEKSLQPYLSKKRGNAYEMQEKEEKKGLGCVNKTYKNCDNCCCSSRLVAPTKTLKREKRHNAVCDIAALNKIS